MSMFEASMKQAYLNGELKDDGMTSAWLRQMVEENEIKRRQNSQFFTGPSGPLERAKRVT